MGNHKPDKSGNAEMLTDSLEPDQVDYKKAQIENAFELTTICPAPGARGAYGGVLIAQSLAAAQRTVPANFSVHSMHCLFLLAGDPSISVIYYVEHLREGNSFVTRAVQACQRGHCIFTTTVSFARLQTSATECIRHAYPMSDALDLPEDWRPSPYDLPELEGVTSEADCAFAMRRIDILNEEGKPHEKKSRRWIRAKGNISEQGGQNAHLAALAFMSDSYFLGTVSRVHNLWRSQPPPSSVTPQMRAYIKRVTEFEGYGHDPDNLEGRPIVKMIVSLDHTFYFHAPQKVRADEWIFTEMESPWAGDERGLVVQRMFTADGVLIGTCVQEGVLRLERELKSNKIARL